VNNTDERVIDEMPASRYMTKTKENYKTAMELLEVAFNELDSLEYADLMEDWTLNIRDWRNRPLASWQEIEMLVGELEGLGVERSILGEVFGIETNSERWLFD